MLRMASESSDGPYCRHSPYSCPLWRFFRTIGYPFSALLFVPREILDFVAVGVWDPKGQRCQSKSPPEFDWRAGLGKAVGIIPVGTG